MAKSQKTIQSSCPECDNPIKIQPDDLVGSIIECDACGTESEILSLAPAELAPLEEEK